MTCRAVWNALPVAGVCHHASYSGSEGVLILPKPMRLPPENATHCVEPGDVGFTWFAPGDAYGVIREFAEICWFYDRDARPSMHEGPAPVNLFARITGDASAFFARSRAMRRSGVTGLLIDRIGGPELHEPIAYHDPAGEAPLNPRRVMIGGSLLSVVATETRCMLAVSDDAGARWRALGDLGSGNCGNVAVAQGAVASRRADPLDAGASMSVTAWAAVSFEESGPIGLARVTLEPRPTDRPLVALEPARQTGLDGSDPSVAVMPDGAPVIAYRTAAGIACALSEDGGITWRDLGIPAAPEMAERPVPLPTLDGRLYCAFAMGRSGPRSCLTQVEV